MTDWWPAIGETSVALGAGLGWIWAVVSTMRRRAKFLRAGLPPGGQLRWFLLSFLSMGSYFTLVAALGLAAVNDILPQTLFWYLLGLSAAAFSAALMVPGTSAGHDASRDRAKDNPPADPPLLPVRRSA